MVMVYSYLEVDYFTFLIPATLTIFLLLLSSLMTFVRVSTYFFSC